MKTNELFFCARQPHACNANTSPRLLQLTRAAAANDSTLMRPSSSLSAAASSALLSRSRHARALNCYNFSAVDAPDIRQLHDNAGLGHRLGNLTCSQIILRVFGSDAGGSQPHLQSRIHRRQHQGLLLLRAATRTCA